MSAGRRGAHRGLSRRDCSGERTLSPTPFVLLGQPSPFDSNRASSGRHTAWAHCHVPNGRTEDHTESIERQIVGLAPEFRACILSRSVSTPKDLESWNSCAQLIMAGRTDLHYRPNTFAQTCLLALGFPCSRAADHTSRSSELTRQHDGLRTRFVRKWRPGPIPNTSY